MFALVSHALRVAPEEKRRKSTGWEMQIMKGTMCNIGALRQHQRWCRWGRSPAPGEALSSPCREGPRQPHWTTGDQDAWPQPVTVSQPVRAPPSDMNTKDVMSPDLPAVDTSSSAKVGPGEPGQEAANEWSWMVPPSTAPAVHPAPEMAYTNRNAGLPRWLNGKEPTCQCSRHGFDPSIGMIPWRGKWQPAAVFLNGKSHGQGSLVGYSPWGCKQLDTI